jgi:integrase
MKKKSGGINLKVRNGTFYLRKQCGGERREISLGTERQMAAKTKATRFLATLEATGSWDVAAEELRGKQVLKKGESPTFEQMKELYSEFVAQSASPVRPVTFVTNVNALRRLMVRLRAEVVAEINTDRINFKKVNRQTVVGEIRHAKAIFKKTALKFYSKKGVKVHNPFSEMELGKLVRQPYTPLPADVRRRIWDEARELGPIEGLIVVLAMGIGLRKNEIDKARLSWIRMMDGHATFTVQEEEDFKPKSGARRTIQITTILAEEIFRLREKTSPSSFDSYLVAGYGRSNTRKDKSYRRINEWLKSMGVKEKQPLHSMRKEFGSNVFSQYGVGVASKLLGHADVKLTMDTYAGLTVPPVIDMSAMIG